MILLSAAAALLPLVGRTTGSAIVGAMLVAAGAIELLAGTQRREVSGLATAAGGVSMVAGLLFLINPAVHFFPIVNLVIAWLLIRAVLLFLASRATGGSVRTWTLLAAAMELILGALLIAGLSIGTLVVLLFGPTPQLVASFAWVLALSFVINGLLQLEIAGCERDTG